MKLERCQSQPSQSLEEFYAETDEEMHQAMLALMHRLRNHPNPSQLYGLTSLHSLVLLTENHYDTPWWVRVWGLSLQEYRIEFLLHESYHPWHEMVGCAEDPAQAVDMIVQALEWSGAWGSPRRCAWPQLAVGDAARCPIQLCSCHGTTSLEEILENHPIHGRRARETLHILKGLAFPRPAFLSVGDYTLRIVPQDDAKATPWLDYWEWEVKALLPPAYAPWPGAYVVANVREDDEAVEILSIALNWLWPAS